MGRKVMNEGGEMGGLEDVFAEPHPQASARKIVWDADIEYYPVDALTRLANSDQFRKYNMLAYRMEIDGYHPRSKCFYGTTKSVFGILCGQKEYRMYRGIIYERRRNDERLKIHTKEVFRRPVVLRASGEQRQDSDDE